MNTKLVAALVGGLAFSSLSALAETPPAGSEKKADKDKKKGDKKAGEKSCSAADKGGDKGCGEKGCGK